jgi:predicted RNA-binding protein with PIN domain
MNVIGSRPDRWWQDRKGAMARLVEQLDEYVRATSEPVTVVFDGAPFSLPRPASVGKERYRPEVSVVFADRPGQGAADEEIERRVQDAHDPSALTVVSSDKRLVAAVRAAGANVVPSRRFRERLDRVTDRPH